MGKCNSIIFGERLGFVEEISDWWFNWAELKFTIVFHSFLGPEWHGRYTKKYNIYDMESNRQDDVSETRGVDQWND